MALHVNLEQLLQHREFLTALARGLVLDPLEQEELLWETMGEGAMHPPDHAALKPWLARVLTNRARSRKRAERRRLVHEQAGSKRGEAESAADVAARLELIQELATHVQALPTEDRDVVLFRFFENLPPREIAKRLDLPVETIKFRLRRGLSTLRARLDRQHGSRDKWLGSLLPLAYPSTKAAGVGLTTFGVWMMTMKTKTALIGFVALLLLGAGIMYGVSELDLLTEAGGVSVVELPSDSSAQDGSGQEAVEGSGSDGSRSSARITVRTGIEGEIEGRVLDPISEPLAGARITLHWSRDIDELGDQAPVVARARSDESGAFRLLGLDEGIYIVRARADGLGVGQFYGALTKQRPKRLGWILRLHSCDTVVGAVVDSTGKPVAGAWIVAQWSWLRGGGFGGMGSPEVRSDKAGRFTFPAIPMGALVRFVAWSEGRMLGMADMVVGQSPPPAIVLPDRGPYGMTFSLAVSNTKEGKRPDDIVGSIKVHAEDQLVPLPSPIRRFAVPTQGPICLTNLCEGTYEVVLSSEAVAPAKPRRMLRLTKDKPEARVELTWSAWQGIEGRLVYKDGKPAKGISLAAKRGYPKGTWAAESDDQGHFAFPRRFSTETQVLVYFGERGFLFEMGGLQPWSIPMQPGATGRVLIIRRASVLAGLVVDEKSKPVPGAVVVLRDPDDFTQHYGSVLTNRKGEFHLSLTKEIEGPLVLDVGHESMYCKTPLAIHPMGSSIRDGIVLRMAKASSIGGTIVNERGEGIAGVQITANHVPIGEGESTSALNRLKSKPRWFGARRWTFSDRSGRFSVPGLAPGRWLVSVESLGREKPKTEPIVVLASGEKREELRIVLKEGLSIEGRIVTAAGEPVGGAWITQFFAGELPRGSVRNAQPVQAGSDGSFVLKGLHSGRYLLTLHLPDAWKSKVGLQRNGPDGADVMLPASLLGAYLAAGTKGYRWVIDIPQFGEIQARLVQSGEPLQHIQVEMRSGKDKWSFDMPVRQGAVFMKHVLVGSYDLTFKSPRFADLEMNVEVRADRFTDLGTLQLVDLEQVEGRVVDKDGKPLAGVWIGLDEKLSDLWSSYDEGKGIDQFHGRVLVQSDAKGCFRVPIKSQIRVLAFKPGYGPVARSYPSKSTPKGSPAKELILVLSGAAEISIQAPAAPKGKATYWFARLTRLAPLPKLPVSAATLVPEVLPVQGLPLIPGRPVRIIGLRPGNYRLQAKERSQFDSYRKKSVPGESHNEELRIDVHTKRLIRIL